MTETDHPTVRLRPKADAKAIRHGFPWVYADELVLDRRSKALDAGTIALLTDADRQELGLVAVNSHSKIICRMLDRDPRAIIDQNWFAAHLSRALDLRQKLFDAPYYRLIHAEADGLPGVVIDRFGDVAVIQPNAAWSDRLLTPLAAALQQVAGVTTIVKNATGRSRTLEGLDEETTVLTGAISGPIPVPMNGAIYMADVIGGQKTGLFFDQRPNHAFAAQFAQGARMLDVFSHVGGFGLAALAAGASHVTAIDGSAPALALAQEGATRMGCADRFATRKGDAFAVMEELAKEGATFDLIICDPPAFAPAKPALEAGLRAYERTARLAAKLVAPGGILGLCSCSHAADLTRFRNASSRGIGRAGRRGVILHTGFAGPDHPVLPHLAETSYLKSVICRL
ncbi:RSP_2647 family RNA methyltransferase [Actibacterium sp. 188UL27-1]|uniref:RSP_2647 family RNA methyltransferase n=1 Tax=Actibacterium sp. 188UL27-1 TaxID=2786961 RepID=UPI00195E0131|nr:class I SAM-dependent methyltransferase [Actibacterium sp. 188UL27-1]MBM7066719.1 class I SAM-dependent rRNA methyltransferase [Actibacterium sp. 188UL27-1]